MLKDISEDLKPTKEQVLDQVTINTVYKPKAKKIRLVNKNDSTRDALRQKPDQYERSFTQDTPQEHISQFKEHLLL